MSKTYQDYSAMIEVLRDTDNPVTSFRFAPGKVYPIELVFGGWRYGYPLEHVRPLIWSYL